jgi:hypothetical protein
MSGRHEPNLSNKRLECAVLLLKLEVERGGPPVVSDQEIATWNFDGAQINGYKIDEANYVWDHWRMGAEQCL